MQGYKRVCEQAARAGGEVLLQYRNKFNVREKGPADLVTEADLASQVAVREFVLGAFPDHNFLGEEDDPAGITQSDSDFTWIVDPLDGTTNYVHGLENYCVSVALQHRRDAETKIIEGAIYDPLRDRCYRATLGSGAFCNGEPLHVSNVAEVGKSLIAASLPAKIAPDSGEIERFVRVMLACQAIRRLGSAALNLCYVAAGQLDAYWATSVKQWDVAAGLLIVKEAGGQVSHITGGPLSLADPKFIVSATANLHTEMVDLLDESG